MTGYVALGFVLGMFASAVATLAYCWLKTHSDRICDAIEAVVWECFSIIPQECNYWTCVFKPPKEGLSDDSTQSVPVRGRR